MQRLLVVWCPDLCQEHEHGREARAGVAVAETLGRFSPGVDIVRPGVCALSTRGPSRYFGGDEALAGLVAGSFGEVKNPVGGTGVRVQVGVADGLLAALLAARNAVKEPLVVAPGASPDFLGAWPLAVLERPELADLLYRLGIRSLGAFAALPAHHVLARFGTDGALCHQVARGTRDDLPGLRPTSRGPSGRGRGRGQSSRGRKNPTSRGKNPWPQEPEQAAGHQHQPGFWGGSAAVEARAARALARAAEILGPEAVQQGRLQGGRGPAERARLVPWTAASTTGDGGRFDAKYRAAGPPWPGRVPAPAPVVVATGAVPALLVDDGDHPVGVTAGGTASARPVRLSVDGGAWAEVVGWAGPWPADERWWSAPSRRRLARIQVVTASGAHLLAREQGRWWVEGTYD